MLHLRNARGKNVCGTHLNWVRANTRTITVVTCERCISMSRPELTGIQKRTVEIEAVLNVVQARIPGAKDASDWEIIRTQLKAAETLAKHQIRMLS